MVVKAKKVGKKWKIVDSKTDEDAGKTMYDDKKKCDDKVKEMNSGKKTVKGGKKKKMC